MIVSRFLKHLSALAALAVLSFASVHAQDKPVIVEHVPEKVRSGEAAPVAPVDESRHLQLALSLPLRDESSLDTLLKDIYDPNSPNFHHYLSTQEFTDRFSPTQQDIDAVVQWAKDKGMQVISTTGNRLVVNVEGSVQAINRAFKVSVKSYQDKETGRTFHAPDREPVADLPVQLLAVSGLDNATPLLRHSSSESRPIQSQGAATAPVNPVSQITGSGPSNTYLPSDMRKAYYGSGPLTGAGQTVAIFSFDGYIASDINVFYASTGMTSTVPVHNVYVAGYDGSCFGFNSNGTINPNICDDGEQILDIVNVIGMAPGLSQVLFYEGNSATAVLNQMASDNIAKVISSSWGGGDFGAASVPAFKQFQAQGQSYLNATGDSGQFNSSTYFPPSVDPNITQVGGTNLVTTGAGGPWASEVAWPYSGGGFVSGTAIPSYQQLPGVINATNKGSTTLRNAPDVAAEGNFDNPTVINGQLFTGYGGTSFAAPRWAGLIALANEAAASSGRPPLGFLNPLIYYLGVGANYAANFHDITSGNNKPTAGSGAGFNAVAGYDLVTGWGSPIGSTLIASLIATPPPPDFLLSAVPISVNFLQGGSVTSTIAVTQIGSFNGSVSLSASGLPSGVTASFSPASTTGTSILTLTASSTAVVGATTVTITGVSGSLTHTVPLTVTVGPSSTGDFALMGSSASVPQGSNGTSTITVLPVGGFAGVVTLSASSLPSGVTASFSPVNTSGTSTLTLTASSTATVGTTGIVVTGVSGALTHTTNVSLTVTAATSPNYSLSASPSSVSVTQGATAGSTITVTPSNGFTGTVALSASGLPSGVTASFSPASTTSSSTLTFTASSTAAVGTSSVTVTGVSGSLTHTATVSLTVSSTSGTPGFTVTVSPGTISIARGATLTSTVTVTPSGGFSGGVLLQARSLPVGVTATFNPATTTGTSIMTLTATSTATLGTVSARVTGSSGTLSSTANVPLTVTAASAGDYSLSAGPSSISVVQGGTGASTITVSPTNGFTGAVSLSASGLPSGVTASFSPASTTGTSVLTLTALSAATVGTATVTVTGVSGSLTHTTTIPVTVSAAPDYSLSAVPASVAQGGSGTSNVSVNALNGFTGSVALAVSGLPTGVTASFSPATTTSSSVLTFVASSTATLGTATVTITGTSGSLTHTVTVALTVTAAADYAVSASPSVSIVQGGAGGSSTVTVTPSNGFSAAVSLSASGLPTGVTASFSPANTTSSSTLTLTASGAATLGAATVTITGVSGSLTHTTTVSLTVTAAPDFALSASPSVSIVQGGASGTSGITVTPNNGFSGAVNLSASGLPTGVTASFSPTSTTGSSTLTLTASSAATLGTATVTITGVSGSLTHTTTVALTVTPAPDFALSASPSVSIVQGGASGTSGITVTPSNGFSGAVNLSASGLPSGVTASFSPASTTTSSTLTLTASSAAAAGTATITITGVSGGLTHTATLTLTVTAAPDFALSATPSVSIKQGATGTSAITVTPSNGFSGAVSLSASGLPAGVTAAFSPATTTSTSTLTFTVAATATTGTATVVITGVSGGLTHTTAIALTITGTPSFTVSTSAPVVSMTRSSTSVSTITITPAFGFTGPVLLQARSLPVGVTAVFSPSTTSTGSSVMTLTANSTATLGTVTARITGSSGSLASTVTVALTVH